MLKGTMTQTFSAHLFRWTLIGLALCLAVLGVFYTITTAFAAPAAGPLAQSTAEGTSGLQGVDVVVVLDDSGSMATCWPWRGEPPYNPPCRPPSENPPSDPTDLRYSAARLLLQLADEDDRIAVIRFDAVADGVGMLGNLQRIGDGTNRRALTEALQPPTDYHRRGYTRIDLGMELALNILQSAKEPGRNQYILLLTDGEPTQPDGAGPQDARVSGYIQSLRSDGVLTFPVVLCNEVGGCPADFVREQFTDISVAEATTAPELLRAFAEIFAQMKPDRSVLTNRNADGALEFTTRTAHGARAITLVTTRDGLLGIHQDEAPMLSRNALDDNNINVSILEAENLGEGDWNIATTDRSGFAVLTANSYPQLLNPPPSIGASTISTRYYPAGKLPLILARGVGPGADEPLILNNQQPMESFGQSHLRVYLPNEAATSVRLQLGQDTRPLQLIRTFRLSARDDLPRVEILSPSAGETGVRADGRAQLQAGFGGGGALQGIGGTVFVFESDGPVISPGDEDGINTDAPLVHQAVMSCADRICTDTGFEPVDGRTYQVYFVLQGQKDGIRFSDWAHADLTLAPAVVVRGLPQTLDLAQMPLDGWSVELGATTREEIGELTASLRLSRADSGEEISVLGVEFDGIVPMEGTAQTTLRIIGMEELRPGDYTGTLALQARSPSGVPMDVTIRPATEIPVNITIDRPMARLDARTVDFGEVLFDTSPAFRLNEEFLLPIDFQGFAFRLDTTVADGSCSGVTVNTGDPTQRGDALVMPLRVTSTAPVQPGTCTGALLLSGPNEDYDVVPNRIDWQVRVDPVQWSIVSGDLHLTDLQDAGARIEETLLIRFTGKTPFIVEIADFQVEGSAPVNGESTTVPRLTSDYLDIPPVEVTGPPNENGVYAVPLTIIARQGIPFDPLQGTFYSGQMQVRIAGLPGAVQPLNVNFRSPSIIQRYFAPWVVPVYSMPLLLCTGPLTLFLLLFMVARVRGRNVDHEELEQVAAAAAMQMKLVDDATASAAAADPFPVATPAASGDASSWGSGEWGSVWNQDDTQTSGPVGSGYSANGSARAGAGDPWSSSW